jgi:two-component system, cell cycle sensor histidine kinase and response regulator CckA
MIFAPSDLTEFSPKAASAPLLALVVEDESLVAIDIEERLVQLGYEVAAVVDNGADALRYAQAMKFDLVLMDIHLRGESDGIQTAATLRETMDIPVVFLTAHSDETTLDRAGRSEPLGYLLKPFDERDLRATLQMAHYRHRSESRLRKLQRGLAATLQSIGDGVIATDGEGRLTFINAMAEARTGWTRDAALGRHLSEVFPITTMGGSDETFELLDRAMTDGAVINLSDGRCLRTRDGQLVPLDYSLAPIRDEQGWITGCVVIFRDNTAKLEVEKARRQVAAKMEEAQRLESLGALTGDIAYDFNNLLVTVKGGASLGKTMVPAESPVTRCLGDIEHAAERAVLLCQQMLAYAGKAERVMEEADLSALARETAPLLQAAVRENATFVLDLASGLPALRGDVNQIKQVILNLVMNGSEALGEAGGKLSVRTGLFSANRAFLSSCRVGADLSEGDYLLLEVSDTGHGMSPEVLARIFDPFFTTKITGRGLGLAATSGIVRSHGGAIAVESKPDLGTTFRVLLPSLGLLAIPALPSLPNTSWRGSGRALLIDDELAIRLVGSAMLRHLGFEVETAEEGLRGVEMATSAGSNYRFILLDLTMPKFDGHAAFLAIRCQRPTMPVLLMSGYSAQWVEQLLDLGGPVAFIQKPFALRDLVAKLQPMVGA